VICPDDTVLHIRTAAGGALAFADGLTRPRGGGLRFMPGFLLGDDPAAVRVGLRESLRRLLDLDFDNLLFAHGEPLTGAGNAALRDFVTGG
jgi:glyoxylase-like metal-dependent hydrolase (beta-lactamase superfamily II)